MYFPNRAALLQDIASNTILEDSLEYSRNQQTTAGFQTALSLNSAITTTQTWETARKTLNDIYIRRLLQEPLTQSYYDDILDLAGEDPAVAGDAVQDAVLFLGPCDQPAFRVIEGAEEEERLTTSVASINNSAPLQIIPNPSTGAIEIAMPKDFTGPAIILNSSGKKVTTEWVKQGVSTMKFHLERESPGLYWLILSDPNGQIIATNRFALIR